MTEVGAFDVHVRPATRADAPGIVWVSNSSILPGEDVGFGGGIDSPFHDASTLAALWRDPNVVQGEEVLVAEMDGRIVGCVTVEDRGGELELVKSTSRYSFRAEGSVQSSCDQSRSEPEQKESRQSLLVRAGTQWAWLGSHFPGGNTSGTSSPTKRKTNGPGQSDRGSRDTTAERTLDRRRSSRMSTLPDVVAGRQMRMFAAAV